MWKKLFKNVSETSLVTDTYEKHKVYRVSMMEVINNMAAGLTIRPVVTCLEILCKLALPPSSFELEPSCLY